jgi:hypothetical protein
MPTASEAIQDAAPSVWERTLSLEAQLRSLASPARSKAEELDLWHPSSLDLRGLDSYDDDEVAAAELSASGLLGTGITRLPESGDHMPVVFIRVPWPVLWISLDPDDTPALERPWRLLGEFHIQPGDAVVIALPEPQAQVGPSDPAHCNGPPGTFGARVQTRQGTRGILTAGHVAPRVPSSAYTTGPSYVGRVVETHDIASLKAKVAGVDVAVQGHLKGWRLRWHGARRRDGRADRSRRRGLPRRLLGASGRRGTAAKGPGKVAMTDSTGRKRIDQVAHDLLVNGRLLTWAFVPHRAAVTFFIPDDCDPAEYPDSIAGHRVVVRSLPRPISEG